MKNMNVKISELTESLGADPRILAAYLHGSIVKGGLRPDSDVDCALLLYPGCDMASRELMTLTGELSGKLGVTLDIGVLSNRNLVYFVQAIHNGSRIFCRDESLTDALVSLAFSLYGRLKEDRREVEAAYHVA